MAAPLAAAGDGRQELEAVAVVQAVVEANHLASHVNEQLAPQPLVPSGAGQGLELPAALSQHAQHIA